MLVGYIYLSPWPPPCFFHQMIQGLTREEIQNVSSISSLVVLKGKPVCSSSQLGVGSAGE